jgi:cell wall-associated NlpC family hydrolase
VTAAAQAVQRSGFPNAYARWEPKAVALLASVQGSSPSAPTASAWRPYRGPAGRAWWLPAVVAAGPGRKPSWRHRGQARVWLEGRTVRDVDTGRVWQIPIPPGKAGVAVNAALDQVGKRYVWGTRGPNTFDCSGLVSFAWAKAGVSVYPQTDVMWGQEPRATGMPRAGDLWGWPGHVQMFLFTDSTGRAVVVEAPNPRHPVHVVYEYQTASRKMRPYDATPTGVAV